MAAKTKKKTKTITDDDIRALAAKALRAGDMTTFKLCAKALTGNKSAKSTIREAIRMSRQY